MVSLVYIILKGGKEKLLCFTCTQLQTTNSSPFSPQTPEKTWSKCSLSWGIHLFKTLSAFLRSFLLENCVGKIGWICADFLHMWCQTCLHKLRDIWRQTVRTLPRWASFDKCTTSTTFHPIGILLLPKRQDQVLDGWHFFTFCWLILLGKRKISSFYPSQN
jgi:hypothetical protein